MFTVALTGAAALAVASPLFAASSTCHIGHAQYGGCDTNAVAAHSRNHFVHISVTSYLPYKVIDQTNGVVVAKGNAGLWGVDKTITGLYSRYRAEAKYNPICEITGGHITIDNN
ncbi:hypothetical protein EON82_20440 [bacterium]|nr:MAG: hypothetical protein EON82_20440 [bacterium]